MLGPGKYDAECTAVREQTEAKSGVMLIVLDGNKGTGFSCQLDYQHIAKIPALLRTVADEIQADHKRGIP
jgi:hypothetical protein